MLFKLYLNNFFVILCYILNWFYICKLLYFKLYCIIWIKICMKFLCIKDYNYYDYCLFFVVILIINIYIVFWFFFFIGNEIYIVNMSDLNLLGIKLFLLYV